jgi:hypothetical protein
MVGKIKTGSNFKGVLLYNEKEKAEIISKNMIGENSQELTREFLLCQKESIEKPVKHFVISFSEEDKSKLTNEKLEQITKDYLKEMGFEDSQYVAFSHHDTKMSHLHIIANRIDLNHKVVKDTFDRKQSRVVLMKLENKYDLTRTPAKSLNPELHYNKNEKELHKRIAGTGQMTDKQIIKSYIDAALERKPTEDMKFIKLLNNSGIMVIENKAKNGYKFRYKETEYKASTIDRNLSFAKIKEQINHNKQELELKQQRETKQEEKRTPNRGIRRG